MPFWTPSNWSFNGKSFRKSLRYTPSSVPTKTWCTMPWWPGNVCSTKASGHCFPDKFLSANNTESPTWKLDYVYNHFWRYWRVDRCSFVRICRYSFLSRWTCFYLSLNRFDSSNSSGDEHGFLRNGRIWFGVNASKSCGSVEIGVIGLSLKIFSTSPRNFLRVSSFTTCSPTIGM